MKKADSSLPVDRICQLCDVPIASYYYKPTDKSEEESLHNKMKKIHTDNLELYGRRRMKIALKNEGIQLGVFKIARMMVVEHDGTVRPLTDTISEADIIVNGTFQNTENPTDFVTEAESSCLKPNSLIIDVSCDEGMGFFFAKPTTFKNPMFKYETIDYYAVDHTPSYLWESATRSISAALIDYLPTVLAGHESWQKNETIRQAINTDGGVIQNNAILSFQNREPDYPHALIR